MTIFGVCGGGDFETGSPYGPDWPGTCYVWRSGSPLLRDPCVFVLVLGLKVCLP